MAATAARMTTADQPRCFASFIIGNFRTVAILFVHFDIFFSMCEPRASWPGWLLFRRATDHARSSVGRAGRSPRGPESF
jgi:hypothetical protein